jgi:hypothetical protein
MIRAAAPSPGAGQRRLRETPDEDEKAGHDGPVRRARRRVGGAGDGAKTTVYQVAINAGVALTPPGGPVLTRQPNDFTAIDDRVPIALNPGALTHDIRLALGGVLAPDGSISGPSAGGAAPARPAPASEQANVTVTPELVHVPGS